MIIGIAGMSRSGKTTLALALAKRLSGTVQLLHLDDFVFEEKDLPRISGQGETRTDWEHPSGIDFEKIYQRAKKASSSYDWVILEGFMLFYTEKLRALCEKKIMLTISFETFYARRKPTYTPPEPDWYIQYVWDAYQQYHAPFERSLDLLLLPELEKDKIGLVLDFIDLSPKIQQKNH